MSKTETDPAKPTAAPGPWRSPIAWAILIGTTIAGLASDLISKQMAFAQVAGAPVTLEREAILAAARPGEVLPPHDPITVIPSVLEFVLVLNPGAVFGAGAGKRWLFVAFTLAAITFAIYMFAQWTRAKDFLAHACLGLLVSGGLGNLYDRLLFACVRDFIHPLPGVHLPFGLSWGKGGSTEIWPWVSNVADLWLLVGIGGLLVYSWTRPEPGKEHEPDAPAAER